MAVKGKISKIELNEGLKQELDEYSLALNEMMQKQEDILQSINNSKNKIANAISNKGITTSNVDTFDLMATNISKIKTGYIKGDTLLLDKFNINYNYNLPLTKMSSIHVKTIPTIAFNKNHDKLYIPNNNYITNSKLDLYLYDITTNKYTEIDVGAGNTFIIDDIHDIPILIYNDYDMEYIIYCKDKKIFTGGEGEHKPFRRFFIDKKNKYIYISYLSERLIKIDYGGNLISKVENININGNRGSGYVDKTVVSDGLIYTFFNTGSLVISNDNGVLISENKIAERCYNIFIQEDKYMYIIQNKRVEKYLIDKNIKLVKTMPIPDNCGMYDIDLYDNSIYAVFSAGTGSSYISKYILNSNNEYIKLWDYKEGYVEDIKAYNHNIYLRKTDRNINNDPVIFVHYEELKTIKSITLK